MEEDIRWHQRLSHFSKALAQLEQAVALSKKRELSSLEEQGLIQAFEFTHELAWNVLKDFFVHQGNSSITGSRDATREAFRKGLAEDGEGWMEMIKSRNLSSHTYNEEVAGQIANQIKSNYFGLLKDLEEKLSKLKEKDHG